MADMNPRARTLMVGRCVIAAGLLSAHCGSSAPSSGGADAADVEGGSGADGASSSSGGPVGDGAAEDGGAIPPDGGASDHSLVGDSSGDTTGPGSCLGPVDFLLVAGSSGAQYCENLPCEFASTVSIVGPGGQTLTTSREASGCVVVDCAGCQGGGCSGACPAATPLPEGGAQASWDGTVWTSGRTCGSGVGCSDESCAPAGQYTAHMCAYGGPDASSCFGGATPGPAVCVDVPFTYPAQATVVGSLP
jgi:hypothetical protein